jgi:hypothetical protein
MAEVYVRITGADGAIGYLAQLRDSCGRFVRLLPQVGSSLPYAYGIEEGHTRGGRLARKAGGAHYLSGAVDSVLPRAKTMIARELPGTAGGDVASRILGEDIVGAAKQIVPVKSGRLRNSIRVGRF